MEYNPSSWQSNMDEHTRTNAGNRLPRASTNDPQGRSSNGDFVGGIDNEALDFSQLEAFINSEGSQANANAYFGESLASSTPQQPQHSGKLLNVVVVENKRTPGHSLPESPPDSSSEHPYSPSDTCPQSEPNLTVQNDTIYTTLGSSYKQGLLMSDNLILGSHIVVSDQTNEALLENQTLHHHQDSTRILVDDLRTSSNPLLATDRLLLPNAGGFLDRRDDLLLKNSDQPQDGLMHLGFAPSSLDLINHHQRSLDGNLCESTICDGMVYTTLQTANTTSSKKRKLSATSKENPIKSEPAVIEHCPPSQMSPVTNSGANQNSGSIIDDDYAASESCLSDSQYQCIRFQAFQQSGWHSLCDQNLAELPPPHYRVDADKGFNFSNADDAFVCQKKNHFQVTCHVQVLGDAQFVKTADGLQKISSFHLHFYGVKHDCPTQTIRVEQSQSDRSKKPFHPVLVELVNSQVTKVTVGRLHFSETTSNNMRKKGKPNPEQRYFQLVVGLHAHTSHGNYPIVSHASQKIIVRASNPGQFESDVELCWQKGQTPDSVYHAGKVGINNDRPDETLVVHGNLKITGHIIQPSDLRAKKNIVECSTAQQLRNVQKLRVVQYEYEPGFAAQLNRASGFTDTGVIAQEVAKVIPEAVRPAGDLVLESGACIDNFLVVNKERIFMENIGAVKELCKVTDNLETRIDQLERINKRSKNPSIKSTASIGRKSAKATLEESELCSNKFIQIVIIILVVVMALCLAAITTLYLMEAQRHNQLTQASLQAVQRSLTTTRPVKSSKFRTWQPSTHFFTTHSYDRPDHIPSRHNLAFDLPKPGKTTLGKPSDCVLTTNLDEDFDTTNLCQTYCCPKFDAPNSAELFEPNEAGKNNVVASVVKETDSASSNANANKSAVDSNLLNIDKNNVVVVNRPFHISNNIAGGKRQRRHSDDWPIDRDSNGFDAIAVEELQFVITVQGRLFNATLSDVYLSAESTSYNYTYIVPMSKYMPDEYITLIFQSSQAHLKDIEQCFNGFRQLTCSSSGGRPQKQVNENVPSQLINSQSVTFEVDLVGYQSKVMTYRASLKQNQNKCKLSATKLGIEFTEYNFHLYRHCDE